MTPLMQLALLFALAWLIGFCIWLALRSAREERQWEAERRGYEARLADKRARLERYEGRTP